MEGYLNEKNKSLQFLEIICLNQGRSQGKCPKLQKFKCNLPKYKLECGYLPRKIELRICESRLESW